MCIVICPGIHAPQSTQSFLADLTASSQATVKAAVFPAERYPAYSGVHILPWLHTYLQTTHARAVLQTPIVWIGFSAGVVGAIGAAHGWQHLGGNVRAFIALDGWGVPLGGDFPVHRLSHDHFTHWSSALLGTGIDNFYADPAVKHLELWRSPQTVSGWRVSTGAFPSRSRITAANFVTALLRQYGEL